MIIMVDKNKLLSAIEERIEELINIDKLIYISNAPYNSSVEELLRLKEMINNGKFDIQIW